MRTNRVAVAGIRHITAEHDDAARLHTARASQHAEQRRLADALRPISPTMQSDGSATVTSSSATARL
jgi:hypothetical protein